MERLRRSTTDTERVWQAFGALLRQYILARVRTKEDAEDILQTVFLRIHRNLLRLREDDRLSAWIYRIAHNAIIDHYRSKRPTAELPEAMESPDPQEADLSQAWDYAPGVRIMIDRLPEKYRQALVLSEFENITQEQIANRLGLSVPGAKSRVQRARKMLKNMLLDGCHFKFDRLGNILSYEVTERCPCDSKTARRRC